MLNFRSWAGRLHGIPVFRLARPGALRRVGRGGTPVLGGFGFISSALVFGQAHQIVLVDKPAHQQLHYRRSGTVSE